MDYFLQVRGDSMKDVGIMDGDLLAVHSTKQVRNGQIVVARIDDEVTVKRYQKGRSAHQVTLLPETTTTPPLKWICVKILQHRRHQRRCHSTLIHIATTAVDTRLTAPFFLR